MWLVYAKQHGRWVTIGEPRDEADARVVVAGLQQIITEYNKKKQGVRPALLEPHCVPV